MYWYCFLTLYRTTVWTPPGGWFFFFFHVLFACCVPIIVPGNRLHFHVSLSCTGEGNGNLLQCSCLENPRDRGAWWAAVSGVSQSRTRLKRLSSSSSRSNFQEKEMATHSSILAWRILWTGKPGGLLSMGSHRVGHDLAAVAAWQRAGELNSLGQNYKCCLLPVAYECKIFLILFSD